MRDHQRVVYVAPLGGDLEDLAAEAVADAALVGEGLDYLVVNGLAVGVLGGRRVDASATHAQGWLLDDFED